MRKSFDSDNLTIFYFGSLPSIPYTQIKKKILGTAYELSLSFLAPTESQKLNKKYRGKTYIPNTLSFPLTKESGEIIICRSAARKEYKHFDLSYKNYLLYLFIHSCLHLKGLDHGGTMERKEAALMRTFATEHEATHNHRH